MAQLPGIVIAIVSPSLFSLLTNWAQLCLEIKLVVSRSLSLLQRKRSSVRLCVLLVSLVCELAFGCLPHTKPLPPNPAKQFLSLVTQQRLLLQGWSPRCVCFSQDGVMIVAARQQSRLLSLRSSVSNGSKVARLLSGKPSCSAVDVSMAKTGQRGQDVLANQFGNRTLCCESPLYNQLSLSCSVMCS